MDAVRLSARTNPLPDLNRAPSQPRGRGAESSLHTLWITVWIIRKGDRVSQRRKVRTVGNGSRRPNVLEPSERGSGRKWRTSWPTLPTYGTARSLNLMIRPFGLINVPG